MATTGSCFCGATGVTYTGEPAMKALCHCKDCRKISGGAYSVNVVVPEEGFSVRGSPKLLTKTADSGKKITSYFCGDCGTTLYRDGDNFPGMKIVKAGILDGEDALDTVAKPGAELFTEHRVSWVKAVDGAEDKKAMGA